MRLGRYGSITNRAGELKHVRRLRRGLAGGIREALRPALPPGESVQAAQNKSPVCDERRAKTRIASAVQVELPLLFGHEFNRVAKHGAWHA